MAGAQPDPSERLTAAHDPSDVTEPARLTVGQPGVYVSRRYQTDRRDGDDDPSTGFTGQPYDEAPGHQATGQSGDGLSGHQTTGSIGQSDDQRPDHQEEGGRSDDRTVYYGTESDTAMSHGWHQDQTVHYSRDRTQAHGLAGDPTLRSVPEPEARDEEQTLRIRRLTRRGDSDPESTVEHVEEDPAEWARHPDGRWVVGDTGEQPAVRARAPHLFRSPPPDMTIDGAEAGGIVYRAASVRGIRHQQQGAPRQDAYAVRLTKDQEWLVGCVSGGDSSSDQQYEITIAVCERITETLVDHLTAEPPPDDPARWAEAITALPWDRVAKAADHVAGELAFVLATEASPDGTHRAMVLYAAGDAAAFLLRKGQWVPLARAGDEPGVVSARPFSPRVGEPLIVMTGGLTDPLGDATGPVSRFLTDCWSGPPDPLAFAQQLAFQRPPFTADRTAVVVWPGQQPEQEPEQEDTGRDAEHAAEPR